MNQTAQEDVQQTGKRLELSEDVAAMRSSFSAMRQINPQPIDLATWYARVKGNSDGGNSAPTFRSLQAA